MKVSDNAGSGRRYDFFKTYDIDKLMTYIEAHAQPGDVDGVLDAMDDFAREEAYMMNLGPENRHILEDVIQEKSPKNVLELGSYCGYSALCIARCLPKDGRLTSVDSSKMAVPAARRVIEYAGMTNKIDVVHANGHEYIESIAGKEVFEVVFMDHIKKRYLIDLQIMEAAGVIQPGSIIVADNVGLEGTRKHTAPYLDYVRTSEKYESTYHPGVLAYNDQVFDALEVSRFIGHV